MKNLFVTCLLEGMELDNRVAELLGLTPSFFSSDWRAGGPLIESNQVFLSPPHDVRRTFGDGNSDEIRLTLWTATVSAKVRTKPSPNDAGYPRWVGRGSGPTPLIAAMRAIVDSFPEKT